MMGIVLEVSTETRGVCDNWTFGDFQEEADRLLLPGYSVLLATPALVGRKIPFDKVGQLAEEIIKIKEETTNKDFLEIVSMYEWAIARARKFKAPIKYA